MRASLALSRMLLACAVLAGCAKNVDARVAGSDDAAIDALSLRLEELRTRDAGNDATCADRCALGRSTCELAEELCALVERHPDRTDLPPRCAQAQEQCAGARNACARCGP
ncbi:hypothetical protein [Corallococcus macrosporus]|uniref:Lipoprotein n=1 Tax=Corallococcus macrosporus DSM 14697 TaxID=1189310 RepID=A0A250K0S7_9BACT|nr:hypothetical protein [Corallococcus macrosporus]ATB48956.1 hypothetical protein MYMAC_004589 [Corallococcus macrosporus DSM 14697]